MKFATGTCRPSQLITFSHCCNFCQFEMSFYFVAKFPIFRLSSFINYNKFRREIDVLKLHLLNTKI